MHHLGMCDGGLLNSCDGQGSSSDPVSRLCRFVRTICRFGDVLLTGSLDVLACLETDCGAPCDEALYLAKRHSALGCNLFF